LTAETNFGPANLTEHRTVVVQDLDFGELAKTHLPEAITERFLTLEVTHPDFFSSIETIEFRPIRGVGWLI